MKVTQRMLNDYRSAVNEQAELARSYVSRALDAYFLRNPGSSTADGREFAIALLETALPNFTATAGTLAADFFDEMMEAEGVEVGSELYDTTDYSKVEDKVRFFAERLNDGDQEAFKRQVVDATHYFVKRSAYDNMVKNCEANNVRYARVPSGFETCSFCFMLASRGFVYRSEETAKGLHGYHGHCDCCIVPGKKGRTAIDGYDPEGMYKRWCDCAATARLDPNTLNIDASKAIMREVEMRDWHWLYTGERHDVAYETPQLKAQTLKRRPHEDRTANRLADIGFKCFFPKEGKIVAYDSNGRGISEKTADLSSGIELKTILTSQNAYGAVKNYFDDSIGKVGMRRMVIDNFESEHLSDETVMAAVEELTSLEEYRRVFTWVSVLKKNGQLVDVVRR